MLLHWLEELRAGLSADGPAMTLTLRLVVEPDGKVRFAAPAEAAGAQVIEVRAGAPAPSRAAPKAGPSPPVPVHARPETISPGPPSPTSEATLRRRLEMVLGGPPGFTTGARAEVLADLLHEFGSERLGAELHAAWASHFDTGLSASAGGSRQ